MADVTISGKVYGGFRLMNSLYAGVCSVSGQKINRGSQIAYKKDEYLAKQLGLRSASITVLWPQTVTSNVKEKPNFAPSSEQNAIGDAFIDWQGPHILIRARAGTGKTTTIAWAFFLLLAAVQNLIGRCLMLVFGKKNADEMTQKVPNGVAASTLHSYGNQALKKRYPQAVLAAGLKPGKFQKYQRPKTLQLLDRLIPADTPEKHPLRKAARIVPKLVGMAKNYAFLPSQRKEIDALLDHEIAPIDLMGADRDTVVELSVSVLEAGLPHNGDLELYDMDDMIYIPAIDDSIEMPAKAIVAVDECQDVNPAQLALVRKAMEAGARIVAVGDDLQAIMGFRGSIAKAVDDLFAMLGASARGVKELPLTVNHRCGRVHIRNVQWRCPDIKASSEAPEGTIEAATLAQFYGNVKPGHAVLARTNQIGLAFCKRLRCLRIPAVMKGRDEDMEKLIRFIDGASASKNLDLASFLEALEAYYTTKYMELSKAEKPSKWRMTDLAETADTVREMALSVDENNTPVLNVADLKKVIESLYDDDAPASEVVTCSTAHRAKGLEWPVVWFSPIKFPHPNADSMAALEQEYNLIYVRDTRVRAHVNGKPIIGGGRLIRIDGDPTKAENRGVKPEYTPPVEIPPSMNGPDVAEMTEEEADINPAE